jgi:hypothetical protein
MIISGNWYVFRNKLSQRGKQEQILAKKLSLRQGEINCIMGWCGNSRNEAESFKRERQVRVCILLRVCMCSLIMRDQGQREIEESSGPSDLGVTIIEPKDTL